MDESQKKLLTSFLGECWINSTHNCSNALCNRTFLSDTDMMDCMRKLVKEGKWGLFRKFAIDKWMDTTINFNEPEMVTGHRNQRHTVEIGLKKTGPKILTPEQIAEIQIRYQYRVKGGDCLDALAKQYSVSRSTIWRAIYSYDSTQRDRGKEHHDKVGRRRDMRLVAEWLATSS
jgi:hypothetical protein